jgi:hypothetical protein
VNATGNTPGYLPKFGIQPAETVRDLAVAARLKPLTLPGEGAAPGYRPPDAVSRFVRWRDLTCRWPGCDAPVCDVDHTVPYPLGPTHPSNLKLYCRTHHLVKTFYCGPEAGWTESQSADGTVTFTAPTGHRYSTQPAGALLYPALAVATGVLGSPGGGGPPSIGRSLAMPNRRQSRDEDRRSRVARERRRRSEINAGCVQQALRAGDEPPPF